MGTQVGMLGRMEGLVALGSSTLGKWGDKVIDNKLGKLERNAEKYQWIIINR